MVFPVVMYGHKKWTIKKAECQRNDAFKLWCWKRLLRVLWTARRYNQSILKEMNPEYSLEGLMLKLKLQYFGHLIWRADSSEKTLMLGKIEGRSRRAVREWDGWMAPLTQYRWIWATSGRWWRTGKPVVLEYLRSQRVGDDWEAEQQQPTRYEISLNVHQQMNEERICVLCVCVCVCTYTTEYKP